MRVFDLLTTSEFPNYSILVAADGGVEVCRVAGRAYFDLPRPRESQDGAMYIAASMGLRLEAVEEQSSFWMRNWVKDARCPHFVFSRFISIEWDYQDSETIPLEGLAFWSSSTLVSKNGIPRKHHAFYFRGYDGYCMYDDGTARHLVRCVIEDSTK